MQPVCLPAVRLPVLTRLSVTGFEGTSRTGRLYSPTKDLSVLAADVGWLACPLRNMYERDVRQRYCPAALWLAPYSAYAGDGHEFEAAGVVGALLHAGAAAGKGMAGQLRASEP